MSTATLLSILCIIRDYLEDMIVTYKKHVPNRQLNGDEEDKEKDERKNKRKESDLELNSDAELKPNNADDKYQG